MRSLNKVSITSRERPTPPGQWGWPPNLYDAFVSYVRWALKVTTAVALAAVVPFGNPSRTAFAQQIDEATVQQIDKANKLAKRVTELYNAGRYSDSISIAQQVVDIYERAFGRDNTIVAAWLNNLAGLYDSQGRYADAEPLYQRSLAIYEKLGDRDDPVVATVLNNLAKLYESQGRYADAEPLYRRSLAINETAHGRDHLDVTAPLNGLATVYEGEGRYADAEPLYLRALAIREKLLGHDHPAVATSLNNLAGLYHHQGRYAEAESLHKRALAIDEKVFGPDNAKVAKGLNNLAEVYESEGRYADAEPLFQRALAIGEKSLGRNHHDVAVFLNNLAVLYKVEGRYADAEPLDQRALMIFEQVFGHDHPTVAMSLSNLASLFDDQGRYAEAEPLYERALAIREKALDHDHPAVAASLNNLAKLYNQQGRYADAESLYKRALAIDEKVLGPDNAEIAIVLNNLAELYRLQGRYSDAESLYRRALAIRERTHSRDHPDLGLSLNNLAALYNDQGRYAAAESLYQRALKIRESTLGRDHHYVSETLDNLASTYMERAKYADALAIIRRKLSQGNAEKFVALPVLFASQRENLINPAQALRDSYEVVQRASSSAAAGAVSKLAARFAAGTDELAQLVRKDQDLTYEAEALDKSVIAFVSKPPAERSATAEDAIRKRIEEIKAEREKLQHIFVEHHPDYAALFRPPLVSLSETQALLAPDEALLVFDFGPKSFAWIITKSDAEWKELAVSGKGLEVAVRDLRSSLSGTFSRGAEPIGRENIKDWRFDADLAYKVYRETIGVFGEKIASKRLSIVTNGALTGLPPQLLVTKDPSGKGLKELDWLVRSHAITILPSVASLKVLRGGSQVSSARKPIIAFADPVFSKAARAGAKKVAMRSITSFYRGTQIDVAAMGEHLPQLPGTRKEVRQVATELHAAAEDIRLGLAATETAVKRAKLDQYRIVYFATHGLVAGELEPFAKSKAEPALVLTIPDNPNDFDDGLLTASEIAQLRLDADWAVLSACNTAAEEKPGAEALSGLARAFFYAGARSLIVSHWDVDDEAAARLMVGTFGALSRDPKLSHAEALRQSMLAMIEQAKSDYQANPQFWAPFVVVGEPAKPR